MVEFLTSGIFSIPTLINAHIVDFEGISVYIPLSDLPGLLMCFPYLLSNANITYIRTLLTGPVSIAEL